MTYKTSDLPKPGVDRPPRGRPTHDRVAMTSRLRPAVASILALSVLCLGVSAPAQAADPAILEWQYTTTIDATRLGGAADAPVRITYRFDSALAAQQASETFASYGPLIRVIVEIGDQCVALSGPGTEILVLNDAGNEPVQDAYDVRADIPATTGTSMFGLPFQFFRFLVYDPEATMFTDTSLPLTTGFAGAADLQQITFDFLQNRRRVSLSSTDTPPGTLSVFDPAAIIGPLKDQVNATNLNTGVKEALVAPLDKAVAYLTDAKTSNDAMAIKELEKFRTLLNSLPGNVISTSDAAILSGLLSKKIGALPACF